MKFFTFLCFCCAFGRVFLSPGWAKKKMARFWSTPAGAKIEHPSHCFELPNFGPQFWSKYFFFGPLFRFACFAHPYCVFGTFQLWSQLFGPIFLIKTAFLLVWNSLICIPLQRFFAFFTFGPHCRSHSFFFSPKPSEAYSVHPSHVFGSFFFWSQNLLKIYQENIHFEQPSHTNDSFWMFFQLWSPILVQVFFFWSLPGFAYFAHPYSVFGTFNFGPELFPFFLKENLNFEQPSHKNAVF